MKFFGHFFWTSKQVYRSPKCCDYFLFVIYVEPRLKRFLKFEDNVYTRLIFGKFEYSDKSWLN